jgi:AraC-like DNA-binding protein
MTRTPQEVIATPGVEMSTGNGDRFDVITQVLELVRLTGAIFFRASFRSPWAYDSPPTAELAGALPPGPGSLVMFHVVAEGECWVSLGDECKLAVSTGDVVVLPYGDANAFGSWECADPVPIATLMPPLPWTEFPHVRYGGEGELTQIVCGYLRGDALLFDPVLRALPPVFVVHPPSGPAAAWVAACIEYALSASHPPAVAAVTGSRLSELLFTEVLRLYLTQEPDAQVTGWLAAVRDPIVGQALSLLHADPARDWTVSSLARSVAVSRTVLAERFLLLLGRPPIRYLTEWRLNLATGLLRSTDLPVAQIAPRVGYTSEQAFSRAFKRAFGKSPSYWRDHVTQLPGLA